MLDSTPAAGDPLFDAKVAVRHADWIAENPEAAIEELVLHETFHEGGKSITLAASFDWRRIAPGPEPPSLKRYRVERGDQAIDWLEFHYRPGGPQRFRLGRPDQEISVESIDVVRAWARCLADFGRRVLADYGIGDARPHELPTVNRAVSPKVMAHVVGLGESAIAGVAVGDKPRFPEPSSVLSPKAAALREILRDAHPVGVQGPELFERMRKRGLPIDQYALKRLKKELAKKGCPIGNELGAGYFLVSGP